MSIYPKARLIVTVLLLVAFLASCAPGTATPAPTVIPSETTAPTITPTPAPQSLADAPDLPTWIEDYVHAYGGKVTVNGAEMDADQLTDAIRQNPDDFTQGKSVNGTEYLFLVVNDTPLAFKNDQTSWGELTLVKIDSMTGNSTGSQLVSWNMDDPKYLENLLKVADFVTIDGELSLSVLLPDGRDIELLNMVRNGEDLTGVDRLFDWQAADKIVRYANAHGLKVQAHHIFVNWGNLTDEVKKGLRSGEISYDDYEKFLKLYTQTIVSHYNQVGLKIDEWTVTNEVAGALLWSEDKDILRELFINRDLMTKLCQWVKEVNPGIRTIVSEDHLFENQSSGLLDTFINLVKNSLANGAPIDEIGIQNHLWIYSFPTEEEINSAMNKLNKLGLAISSTEVTISISKTNFFSAGEDKRWNIQDDDLQQEQAKAYGLLFSILHKNALFGFTDALSNFSIPKDPAYDPTAKACILDGQMKPKVAYFTIVQLLFKQIH
jgi:GH35 family endo-1,4-beta-xylanase